MSTADLINGAFEFGAFVAILLNCRKTHLAKGVKGVSYISVTFFTIWGYWNLYYYYSSLDQWFSAITGAGVAAANTLWVSMIIYYQRKRHDRKRKEGRGAV